VPSLTPTIAIGATRTDTKGISQVYVPAGCFDMGSPNSDKEAFVDESPEHKVCLSQGFWIDQYEVSNHDFQEFVEAGGYQDSQYWSTVGWQWLKDSGRKRPTEPTAFGNFGEANQPRIGITWYEAEAYAAWRGGRLPTEAEWEYAACGSDGRRYPWGNTLRTGMANVDKARGWIIAPVGSFESDRSWVGAFDMGGNVREWVQDWYSEKYYLERIINDPLGADSGEAKVRKGGNYAEGSLLARCAFRGNEEPDKVRSNTGFRIVTDTK
jgi:formylglycine-generating enzyme required for sulfatase activity